MKIGIGLPNQIRDVDPTVIPAWASQAERAGFTTLSTIGRLAYPGVMDTVALAAAAGATHTIGLLSSVLLGPVWPATLLAKEIAGIDGVSGGRLTLGIGIGIREDDFVVEGLGRRARGKRLEQDLRTYHDVWSGANVGGDLNPAVPRGTRDVPLLFGAGSPAALDRMARWGQGYVGPSVSAPEVALSFDAARAAWQQAGRAGRPRLVGLVYFALGNPDQGHTNIRDYYSVAPEIVDVVVDAIADTSDKAREAVKVYDELGADELIFSPCTGDPTEIARLAEIVL